MADKKKLEQQDVYLNQLRQMVPGLNASAASRTQVMAEAAKYIEQLQNNLIGQIRIHGYPDKLKTYTSSQSDDRESIRRAVDNYVFKMMK